MTLARYRGAVTFDRLAPHPRLRARPGALCQIDASSVGRSAMTVVLKSIQG